MEMEEESRTLSYIKSLETIFPYSQDNDDNTSDTLNSTKNYDDKRSRDDLDVPYSCDEASTTPKGSFRDKRASYLYTRMEFMERNSKRNLHNEISTKINDDRHRKDDYRIKKRWEKKFMEYLHNIIEGQSVTGVGFSQSYSQSQLQEIELNGLQQWKSSFEKSRPNSKTHSPINSRSGSPTNVLHHNAYSNDSSSGVHILSKSLSKSSITISGGVDIESSTPMIDHNNLKNKKRYSKSSSASDIKRYESSVYNANIFGSVIWTEADNMGGHRLPTLSSLEYKEKGEASFEGNYIDFPERNPLTNKIDVNTVELRRKFTDYHNYYNTKSAYLGDAESNADLSSLVSSMEDLQVSSSILIDASKSRDMSKDLSPPRYGSLNNMYGTSSSGNKNGEERQENIDNSQTSNLSKQIQYESEISSGNNHNNNNNSNNNNNNHNNNNNNNNNNHSMIGANANINSKLNSPIKARYDQGRSSSTSATDTPVMLEMPEIALNTNGYPDMRKYLDSVPVNAFKIPFIIKGLDKSLIQSFLKHAKSQNDFINVTNMENNNDFHGANHEMTQYRDRWIYVGQFLLSKIEDGDQFLKSSFTYSPWVMRAVYSCDNYLFEVLPGTHDIIGFANVTEATLNVDKFKNKDTYISCKFWPIHEASSQSTIMFTNTSGLDTNGDVEKQNEGGSLSILYGVLSYAINVNLESLFHIDSFQQSRKKLARNRREAASRAFSGVEYTSVIAARRRNRAYIVSAIKECYCDLEAEILKGKNDQMNKDSMINSADHDMFYFESNVIGSDNTLNSSQRSRYNRPLQPSPLISPVSSPGKERHRSHSDSEEYVGISVNNLCALKICNMEALLAAIDCGQERADCLVREVVALCRLAHVSMNEISSTLTSTSNNTSNNTNTNDINPYYQIPTIEIYSMVELADCFIIDMELTSEESLYMTHVKSNNLNPHFAGLPEEQVKVIARQLLDAIELCHLAGVAHRDVKLSNITFALHSTNDSLSAKNHGFLNQRFQSNGVGYYGPTIKIVDFGMAALIDENGLIYGRCGTPGYVAPEIYFASRKTAYDKNVDLFSIGVVVYVLLCGYEPFVGSNDEDLKNANKTLSWNFNTTDWAWVSNDAMNWISMLLVSSATARMTVKDARNHPWLSENRDL